MPDTTFLMLLERAARAMPGGVSSGKRRADPALAVVSARGAYLETMGGGRLIDYYGDAGAALLGHGDPEVADRVAAAMRRGLHAGVGVSEMEVILAERLTEHIPSAEQVLFCNSGSEATANALRLARAVTARPLVVQMEGSYHGWHDAVVLPGPGVLDATRAATLICPYNDPDALAALFDAHPDQIAAVIIEPIVHNGPTILPRTGYLAGVRDTCDRHGALLIFDEVVTGIRHHLGGVQALWGVLPDLTTMGKSLANGVPIGVLGGPSRMMERLNTHPDGDVPFAGTFNGNAASVSAALAVLDRLQDGEVHQHIRALGYEMRRGLQEIADRAGVEAHATGFRSVFTLWFGPCPRSAADVRRGDHKLFSRYRRELRARGHFEKGDADGARSVISASHTESDIAATLEAAGPALQAALDASV